MFSTSLARKFFHFVFDLTLILCKKNSFPIVHGDLPSGRFRSIGYNSTNAQVYLL